MEIVTVLLFTLALIGCISSGHSIIYALIFGLFLFISYPVYLKYRPKEILEMLLNGVKTSMLRVMAIVGISSSICRYFSKNGITAKIQLFLSQIKHSYQLFFRSVSHCFCYFRNCLQSNARHYAQFSALQ